MHNNYKLVQSEIWSFEWYHTTIFISCFFSSHLYIHWKNFIGWQLIVLNFHCYVLAIGSITLYWRVLGYIRQRTEASESVRTSYWTGHGGSIFTRIIMGVTWIFGRRQYLCNELFLQRPKQTESGSNRVASLCAIAKQPTTDWKHYSSESTDAQIYYCWVVAGQEKRWSEAMLHPYGCGRSAVACADHFATFSWGGWEGSKDKPMKLAFHRGAGIERGETNPCCTLTAEPVAQLTKVMIGSRGGHICFSDYSHIKVFDLASCTIWYLSRKINGFGCSTNPTYFKKKEEPISWT